jgi:hypothetical protein
MKQEVINKLISLLNTVNDDQLDETELINLNNLLTTTEQGETEKLLNADERKDMLKYFFAGWYVYSMIENN